MAGGRGRGRSSRQGQLHTTKYRRGEWASERAAGLGDSKRSGWVGSALALACRETRVSVDLNASIGQSLFFKQVLVLNLGSKQAKVVVNERMYC
jgi:hypothetical protein